MGGIFEKQNYNKPAMETLATSCHRVMCQSFLDFIASPSFLYMPAQMLISPLQDDNINVNSEDEVVDAVLKWIQHNDSVSNEILQQIFCNIRISIYLY